MLLWPLAIDGLLIQLNELVHELVARAVLADVGAAALLHPHVHGSVEERLGAADHGIRHGCNVAGLTCKAGDAVCDELRDAAYARADNGRARCERLHDGVRHVLSTSRARDGERSPLDIRLEGVPGLVASELDTRGATQRGGEFPELGGIGTIADHDEPHVPRQRRSRRVERPKQHINALLCRKAAKEEKVGTFSIGHVARHPRGAGEDSIVREVLKRQDLALWPAALDKL